MSIRGRCPICFTDGVLIIYTAVPIEITGDRAWLGVQHGSMIEMCSKCQRNKRFKWKGTGKKEIGHYWVNDAKCAFVVDEDGYFDGTWQNDYWAQAYVNEEELPY